MWSRPFADVLDDALGADAGAPRRAATTAPFTYQPASPFLFFTLPTVAGLRPTYPGVPQKKGTAPALMTAPLDPMAHVPQPRFETTAPFDARRALTAHLGPDYTAVELRRAYRQLARRIHPDRHQHLGESERARLTREFADLSAQYQELLAAAAPLN